MSAPIRTVSDDFYAAAEWLVEHLGYPIDIGCSVPPPQELQRAIIDYCHADPTGVIHGNRLNREEVFDFVSQEGGW